MTDVLRRKECTRCGRVDPTGPVCTRGARGHMLAERTYVLMNALLDDERIERASLSDRFGHEDYGPSIREAVMALLDDVKAGGPA